MRGGVLSFIVVTALAAPVAWAVVGGGDITFRPAGAASVLYSHDYHVTQKKLKCSECHYRLFTTMAQHHKVTMADMQKGSSCGWCHNGDRAFDVKGNCGKCHKG